MDTGRVVEPTRPPRQTVSPTRNGGAGPLPSGTTPPLRGCLRYTRPAPDGGTSQACGALGTGQVGSGGHRTNGDSSGQSGNDGATGAALHSGNKHKSVRAVKRAPRARGPAGVGTLPPDSPPEAGSGGNHGVAGDPSTSRSGARTFRRITGHMTATQPSRVRGYPRHSARPPALWS